MTTYPVSRQFNSNRVDQCVIVLRKEGFTAYSESTECGQKFYVVTDAPRSMVLLCAGHGQFLNCDTYL